MGLFDIDDKKLQALYAKAWMEEDFGFVDIRKYPYLEQAFCQYINTYHCTLDEAIILARTGKRVF